MCFFSRLVTSFASVDQDILLISGICLWRLFVRIFVAWQGGTPHG